jgi:hypothetical protein
MIPPIGAVAASAGIKRGRSLATPAGENCLGWKSSPGKGQASRATAARAPCYLPRDNRSVGASSAARYSTQRPAQNNAPAALRRGSAGLSRLSCRVAIGHPRLTAGQASREERRA